MGARVSVGMPVWNGEAYVASAVKSILSQTYSDFELVIGDNGSTDATEDICRALAATDVRVRYHRHSMNLGAARNHNFVFEQSTGEYFKWAAYDDLCAPEMLHRCVEALDENPAAVNAYPRTRIIDESGSLIEDYNAASACEGSSPQGRLRSLLGVPADRSLLHWCYPIYGLMRASVLRQTALIAPYNASDDVLIVELALRGHLLEVPAYLFSSRRHANRSLEANTTQEAVAAWFDPGHGGRFPAGRTRVFLGYANSIRRVPMSPADRLACYRVLAGWVGHDRRWRVIGGELRIKGRELAAASRAAAAATLRS